jgi:hypothetical protein
MITINTWGLRMRIKLFVARLRYAIMYRGSDFS